MLGLLVALWQYPLLAQDFDVYVSDAAQFNVGPWGIYKYGMNGENGTRFISDQLGWPQDIVFLEEENTMLVSNLNDGRITRHNAGTGVLTGEFATGIGGPTRMKIGPDGLLYVLQWQGNGKVRRYQPDGTFLGDFTATGVSNSIGLDWDASGNLYVSSYNGNFVKKFSPDGADLGKFISSNLNGPTNIWFRENGDLMVCGWGDGTVKRFNSDGVFQEVFISGIAQVEGVDFFPNGDIALGVGSQSTVKVYSPDGTFIKNLFTPGAAGVVRPNAVVFRFKNTTNVREVYREITIVTPAVGKFFRVSGTGLLAPGAVLKVFDSGGALVSSFHPADSTHWDASHLTAGIYHITATLADGAIAGQKVVVQH